MVVLKNTIDVMVFIFSRSLLFSAAINMLLFTRLCMLTVLCNVIRRRQSASFSPASRSLVCTSTIAPITMQASVVSILLSRIWLRIGLVRCASSAELCTTFASVGS